MKGCKVIGSPSGIIRDDSSGFPSRSTSVGSGGILSVTRQLNVKETPAGIEISPDGVRKTSGTG